jgi:2-isopropylmalate synthase
MSELEQLIYDWNVHGREPYHPPRPILLDDETLRDGLQSPSVLDPDLDHKIRLIHLMDQLGISTANVGLPGAGARQREDILRLAQEVVDSKLNIGINVACRTVISDIEPVVEMSQKAGMPIEVCAFIGSSEIRQFTESWDLALLLKRSREALEFAEKNNLTVMYVTEDTTRAHPQTVQALYSQAVELGAKRVCVCDTVGHSDPNGAYNVVQFVKHVLQGIGMEEQVGIDWHGHRDRGLALANCIAAVEAGATRVHGAALGIGERTGNAPMDLLLVNFVLMGWLDHDIRALPEYVQTVAEAVGVQVPYNYPALGQDAFVTGTGVHAAAVIKALRRDDRELADAVYSGVPAALVGKSQVIGIGPMSGRSNVQWVLERLKLDPTDDNVQKVLAAAKGSKQLLSDEEIREAVGA